MADGKKWYYARGSESVGPFALDELMGQLPSAGGKKAMIFGPGLEDWTPAGKVQDVIDFVRSGKKPKAAASSAPSAKQKHPQKQASPYGIAPVADDLPEEVRPVASRRRSGKRAHEIDYELFGEEMQFAEITLDPGETVIAEAGAMMYMSAGIEMQTLFGDPGGKQGFFGKVLTAGKRVLTGESMFITTFSNISGTLEQVAFASPYPGKIVPLHLDELGGQMICQKDSFICAAQGIDVGIAFQKRIGTGLFGGEGFIMQRLTGDGIALIHAGGTLRRQMLQPGETVRIDTGCLVALQPTVDYDIGFVGGIKNSLFGGEGLFLATLTGPGEVWMQSLPFSRLAGRIARNVGSGKGEGSLLGGLGDMIMGDND